MSDVWTPSDEFTANEGDLGDLAFINYEDLIPSLQKDLQIDLSTDSIQHTGNDSPNWQDIPTAWFYANWKSYAAPFTAQYWQDANGWVHLRGLVQNIGAYAYNASTANILQVPAELIHPTRPVMLIVGGYDVSSSDCFVAQAALSAVNGAGGLSSAAQTLWLQAAVAGTTNTGSANSWIILDGLYWSPK